MELPSEVHRPPVGVILVVVEDVGQERRSRPEPVDPVFEGQMAKGGVGEGCEPHVGVALHRLELGETSVSPSLLRTSVAMFMK